MRIPFTAPPGVRYPDWVSVLKSVNPGDTYIEYVSGGGCCSGGRTFEIFEGDVLVLITPEGHEVVKVDRVVHNGFHTTSGVQNTYRGRTKVARLRDFSSDIIESVERSMVTLAKVSREVSEEEDEEYIPPLGSSEE